MMSRTGYRKSTKMELKDILNTIQPDRPRQRVTLPIPEWIGQYHKNGFVQIPIYMSKKEDENPDGYKWSKVRSILALGHGSLSEKINTQIRHLFATAFFATSRDRKTNFRFVLVVPSSEVSAMRKQNYLMKPIVESLSDIVTTEIVVAPETPEEAKTAGKTNFIQEKAETPQKKTKSKSKRSQKK